MLGWDHPIGCIQLVTCLGWKIQEDLIHIFAITWPVFHCLSLCVCLSVSLCIYMASFDFLKVWWPQSCQTSPMASRTVKVQCPSITLPHSIGQCQSQGQPSVKAGKNWHNTLWKETVRTMTLFNPSHTAPASQVYDSFSCTGLYTQKGITLV